MKKGRILTYDEVAVYAPGSSSERLVDVAAYDGSIVVQYEKEDMLPITGVCILVRDAVAKKLALVARDMRKRGYTLKMAYGYRHPSIQEKYFINRRSALAAEYPNLSAIELDRLTHNFVAVPSVAGHPTGGAVDLTLLCDGVAVDMGTAIADFSDAEKIKTYAQGLTREQVQNRQILHDAMVTQGFAPFYGEWWHFSYGDQEWAAFYDKESALYGQIAISETLVMAAGGNGTAIQSINLSMGREEYKERGRQLGQRYEKFGAEQAGFLNLTERSFEMAGGEFCGNAARAAAVLLSKKYDISKVSYTVSGFDGVVDATVDEVDDCRFYVKAIFPGMKVQSQRVRLTDESDAWVVDLGGIIHVMIEADFPTGKDEYSRYHKEVVDELGLGDRDAVGVVWFKRDNSSVRIDPVVWVRSIDTLFYETSCGSGSIAAADVTGEASILQPSGQPIEVGMSDGAVSLASEMEVVSLTV